MLCVLGANNARVLLGNVSMPVAAFSHIIFQQIYDDSDTKFGKLRPWPVSTVVFNQKSHPDSSVGGEMRVERLLRV